MGFEKGNTLGKYTKRGKGKKTIVRESINALESIGINPIEISKEIIDNLAKNSSLSNKEQISFLQTMTQLFKYSLLTKAEMMRLREIEEEIKEVKEVNESILSSHELLKKLKEEKT